MKRTRRNHLRHQLQHLVQHHPHTVAAGVVALCSLPGVLLMASAGLSLNGRLVLHAALAVLAVLLLTACGWWSEVGLIGRSRWRNFHLAALPLAAMAMLYPGASQVTAVQFLPWGMLALLFALEREVWFRGILFRALVPTYGPRRTVALTAVLFGLTQGADLLAGAAPGVTLVKTLASVFFGYVLGALRLRTRSIWPGILVVTLFYVTAFLERLQASGEFLPPSPDRMSLRVFLSLVVFFCARFWMRKADEKHSHEAETVRAS